MLPRAKIREVLTILQNHYGSTTTALRYNNLFQLLVATILSAQSTDKQVNKITADLFDEYPDAESFLKLSENELEKRIKSIGLYKNKAKNILKAADKLVNDFGGKVPDSREKLMELPGVGRKTANVVLSIGFRQDAIAVDTHVFRVSNRIGLAEADTPKKTEEQLMKNIPRFHWSNAHHWLIWHGRQVCKASRPLCSECPLKHYCLYYQELKPSS
ncbi:MAG: endonuclease III [Calditrichaeota bacterium]|nr:endonuclease III [Calditrichota bacterium]RQW03853.1 MAG: endonuclease III [Calditrichota bacterium]